MKALITQLMTLVVLGMMAPSVMAQDVDTDREQARAERQARLDARREELQRRWEGLSDEERQARMERFEERRELQRERREDIRSRLEGLSDDERQALRERRRLQNQDRPRRFGENQRPRPPRRPTNNPA